MEHSISFDLGHHRFGSEQLFTYNGIKSKVLNLGRTFHRLQNARRLYELKLKWIDRNCYLAVRLLDGEINFL
jgi:hypothetical protein